MKHSIACLGLMIVSCLTSAFAKDAPTSAEQLRSEVETALRAKDTNAFLALFNLEGVSNEMKSMVNDICAETVKNEVKTVKLSPLPADFQATNEVSGIRYKPNIPILGLLTVDYVQTGNAMDMPYGKKGNVFCFPGTLEEQISRAATKEKFLNILALGSGKISGSYVFVKNGKEITEKITDSGSKAFWGDYIKSCTVQQDSSDKKMLSLIIEEDGKRIFKSTQATNSEPIIYEKK